MTTINQYQAPQRAYSEPVNYGPDSIFSETTNNNVNPYSQAQNLAVESIVPNSQITVHPEVREPTTIAPTTTCPSGYDIMECKVVELTNQHRQRHGKSALAIGEKCTALSQSHANDMSRNGFFSHTSPSNGSFQSRSKRFGLSGAGENIASGQLTPESVMQAWIKSPGHNENLLRTGFTKVGVSRVGNQWVQCFSR